MENHVGNAIGLTGSSEAAEKLPKELQNVLPSDPFELLRISRALALQACSTRIQGLQDDNSKLQQSSDSSIRELQGKVSSLQMQLNQANEKLSKAEEEQEKLVEEKTALVAMVKKLNRDVAKLETFKRTLMAQLQDEGDEDQSGVKTATVTSSAGGNEDGGSSGAGIALRMAQSAKAKATAAAGVDGTSAASATMSEDSEDGSSSKPPRATRMQFRTPSMTPSIFSPAFTPSATPPHSNTGVSPRTGGKSGRPRVDGKEFFRQARSRLSYEQFSTFLANIKELNAHKQTREETLKKAEDIFGADNKDLYTQFESLLSRHLPT